MFKSSNFLARISLILAFLFLLISGLYFARQFLIPIAISALISMLLIPLANFMESRGVKHVIASFFCVLLILGLFGGIIYLISWQAAGTTDNFQDIILRIQQITVDIQKFLVEKLGISHANQQLWIKHQVNNGTNGAIITASSILGNMMIVFIKSILVMVYIFLFINSRLHLKKFVLMLVPKEKMEETEQIIRDAGKISQHYLLGLGLMILVLWFMYGIAFSIIGVENALFFAVICGILEIVPFIGNLTGTGITILMVISQGGDNGMILGVFISYMIIQFVQTYFLEPLVVGSEVNINPLFTILSLVFMEIIWGIAGMIMAIPMLGIIKIICEHVEALKPIAFLIGKSNNNSISRREKYIK